MRMANRSGLAAVALVSLAVHLALLAWLGVVRGELQTSYSPPPAVTVDIRPVFVPQKRQPDAPVSQRPLIARQSRLSPEQSPVAPVVVPTAPPTATPPSASAAPPSLRELLAGRLDCSEPQRLTREERERCYERLGRAPRDGPSYAQSLDPEEKAAYDAQAARNAAKIAKREGDPFQGNRAKWDGEDAIGDVYVSGSGAEGILGGPRPGPSKRASAKTPRLPP